MEILLTKEKHKELAEELFKARCEADKLVEGFGNLGFMSTEGDMAKLLYQSFEVLERITPEEIREDDELFVDFVEMGDFETFYKKWFEVDKG